MSLSSVVFFTDDESPPEIHHREGVETRSSHRAAAVTSVAYRSMQMEVTPVVSDVLTQTNTRQLQIHFDRQHEVWYLASGSTKTSPNSSHHTTHIRRGRGATTTTTTAGLDGDAVTTPHFENHTPEQREQRAEGGLAQVVAATCASGGGPQNGEGRARATKNVSREEIEGKKAAGTPANVHHERTSGDHDVDQATEVTLPAAEAEKESDPPARKTPEPRAQEGKETGVATEQSDVSADDPDESLSDPSNDVVKEPSMTQRPGTSATAVGESSGRGDGQDGRCQVEKSAAAPGSSNRSEHEVRVEPDTPASSNAEGSTGLAVCASRGAIKMTWRGQPATLVEPIEITLKDSSLRRHAGVSSSIDEGVSVPPEARREAKMMASARHGGSSEERDGDERRAPNDNDGSTHGWSAEGVNLSTSRCIDEEVKVFGGRPEETEAKKADGCSGKFDHAEGKSSARCDRAPRRRREEEALPWDRVGPPGRTFPRSSPSKTEFLHEPYLGPPVAAGCFPAWPPAGTGVMADPKTGARRRRDQRPPRRRNSKLHSSRRARERCSRVAGAKNGSSGSSSAGGTTSSGGGSSSSSSSSREAFGREHKNRRSR